MSFLRQPVSSTKERITVEETFEQIATSMIYDHVASAILLSLVLFVILQIGSMLSAAAVIVAGVVIIVSGLKWNVVLGSPIGDWIRVSPVKSWSYIVHGLLLFVLPRVALALNYWPVSGRIDDMLLVFDCVGWTGSRSLNVGLGISVIWFSVAVVLMTINSWFEMRWSLRWERLLPQLRETLSTRHGIEAEGIPAPAGAKFTTPKSTRQDDPEIDPDTMLPSTPSEGGAL
jgi:hypothetical protein